jgi:hypothetical protein
MKQTIPRAKRYNLVTPMLFGKPLSPKRQQEQPNKDRLTAVPFSVTENSQAKRKAGCWSFLR